jgi:hypothetical protein
LPDRLDDCPVGVQADHYAQACYVAASAMPYDPNLHATDIERLGIPVPPLVTTERAYELRRLAVAQAHAEHGIYGLRVGGSQ